MRSTAPQNPEPSARAGQEELDDSPCRTVEQEEANTFEIFFEVDDERAPRVVRADGTPLVPVRGQNAVTLLVEEEFLYLHGGTAPLTLRFAGPDPSSIQCDGCVVEFRERRTGHNTGTYEIDITLPDSVGGGLMHVRGETSISVSECHGASS